MNAYTIVISIVTHIRLLQAIAIAGEAFCSLEKKIHFPDDEGQLSSIFKQVTFYYL